MKSLIGSRAVRWLVVAAMCALPVQVFAATGPAKLVVVAKSGGDYTSPIAAVNSITDASATNPYLVKVMPGIYDLGTTWLQMKEYVDIEGSGRDNTVIKSSKVNVDFDTCTYGTVMMANNSSLRNIKIVNTAPDQGNANLAAAVVFNNVTAKAEGMFSTMSRPRPRGSMFWSVRTSRPVSGRGITVSAP